MQKSHSSRGIEIRGPHVEGQERILTPDALEFIEQLVRRFGPRREQLLARRQECSAGSARASCRISSPRPPTSARPSGPSPRRGRPHRSPGRDHRPGRAEDDDQRPQLGRAGLHGGLRGRAVAALDQRGLRPGQLHGRGAADARLPEPRGQALRPEGRAGDPGGAPARMAPRGEARAAGRPVRSRPAWSISASISFTTRAS